MNAQVQGKASLFNLPNISFDGGLKGQEIVEKNFVINPAYGLVNSKYFLMQVTEQMFLSFSLAGNFSSLLGKWILHVFNRSSVLTIQSSSGQNCMLQMSITVKISVALCPQRTANRTVVIKVKSFWNRHIRSSWILNDNANIACEHIFGNGRPLIENTFQIYTYSLMFA